MNTNTSTASILCFVIAAFLGAVGQYLYKSGADTADGGWYTYVANPRLAGGVFCYVAVMVLFVIAFKQGGSLTVLYPIYASTFIWAAVIASRVYGTPITATILRGSPIRQFRTTSVCLSYRGRKRRKIQTNTQH